MRRVNFDEVSELHRRRRFDIEIAVDDAPAKVHWKNVRVPSLGVQHPREGQVYRASLVFSETVQWPGSIKRAIFALLYTSFSSTFCSICEKSRGKYLYMYANQLDSK